MNTSVTGLMYRNLCGLKCQEQWERNRKLRFRANSSSIMFVRSGTMPIAGRLLAIHRAKEGNEVYFGINPVAYAFTTSRFWITSCMEGRIGCSGISPLPLCCSLFRRMNLRVGISTFILVFGNVLYWTEPQITFGFPPVSSPIKTPLL